MGYWILKTEPESYSFERLVAEKRARWDGVSNPVALSNIKAMRPGDPVMIYHTGKEKSCVGLAEVVSDPYPDPKDANLTVIDLEAKRALARPVTLAAIKAEASLAEMALVRMPRLSVQKATEVQWRTLIKMSEE